MDYQFLKMILQIVIFLPFIIFLIYLSLKYGGTKFQSMQNGKYIKVLERVSISKDISILLVKLGDKIYVMSSSASGIKELKELDEEEITKFNNIKEETIPQYENVKEMLQKLIKKGRSKDE